MLLIEKEHKHSTLMSMKKEELVKHIMFLEHNNNVLNERIEIQARNCIKLLNKEWIPCSERLPEEDEKYLVSTDGTFGIDVIDIARFENDEWFKSCKIIAWQPLPEPYRGDDHE